METEQGDSGAPVFYITGGNNVLLDGILHSGAAAYGGGWVMTMSPIDGVLADIDNLTTY
jgi:hypothetical protein